ncbi:PAS domain-containing sensor histidine kinase [Ramlibacter sp.]|uniref:PAS domain-containing sensor histidine kinase n=1 Tax=Ramlibacter sp. TaxID=1917967 RepID=UPI003D0EE6BB
MSSPPTPPLPLTGPNADAWLGGLLDSAMDAVIAVDASQRIVLYNRAAEAIFGFPAATMHGQPLETLLPARFRDRHAGLVGRFGHTGVTSRRMGGNTVLYGLRANGEEFPVEASISQLDTPQGKIYTAILRDITERVRAQRELAAFAAEASGIREQERSRIARELHDELAQTLTALKMDTISLRDQKGGGASEARLAGMLEMLDSAVASTRRISADLRPLVLDDLGLIPAIEWLVQNFMQRTGVACVLDADETIELPEPYATGVFRIVQESLTNAGKHAGASRVDVGVAREDDVLVVTVRDDGRGFRPDDPRKPQSLGLVGLRERAQLLRGGVEVRSEPGAGTTVEARIPVGEADA